MSRYCLEQASNIECWTAFMLAGAPTTGSFATASSRLRLLSPSSRRRLLSDASIPPDIDFHCV